MRVYGRLFTALVCRVKKFQINSYFVDVHDAMGERVREIFLCFVVMTYDVRKLTNCHTTPTSGCKKLARPLAGRWYARRVSIA